MSKSQKKILVVDVGGTNVKILASGQKKWRKFPSGHSLTAKQMVKKVKKAADDWKYDLVTIGIPGPVVHGHPLRDPVNLGEGWISFDYKEAFGRPVKIINDAAMQALGSYRGGRMLFLGLGTGLGSAMIVDGVLESMELEYIPYKKGRSYDYYVGKRGLRRFGQEKWERYVLDVVKQLKAVFTAEYVVLGGGNAIKLTKLPPHTILVGKQVAFLGGCLLWNETRPPLTQPAVSGDPIGANAADSARSHHLRKPK